MFFWEGLLFLSFYFYFLWKSLLLFLERVYYYYSCPFLLLFTKGLTPFTFTFFERVYYYYSSHFIIFLSVYYHFVPFSFSKGFILFTFFLYFILKYGLFLPLPSFFIIREGLLLLFRLPHLLCFSSSFYKWYTLIKENQVLILINIYNLLNFSKGFIIIFDYFFAPFSFIYFSFSKGFITFRPFFFYLFPKGFIISLSRKGLFFPFYYFFSVYYYFVPL